MSFANCLSIQAEARNSTLMRMFQIRQSHASNFASQNPSGLRSSG